MFRQLFPQWPVETHSFILVCVCGSVLMRMGVCVCERECGCAAGLACLSYLRIYLGSFDRIPSNCVINVFISLPVGGAASSSMLLCTPGVTDVRRNVWVLRSLLRVSAESCHSAPLHPPPPPHPAFTRLLRVHVHISSS